MGRNKILVFGLLLVAVMGILISLPTVREEISRIFDYLKSNIVSTQIQPPKLPDRESDKKTCGLCHSDKSRDFQKRFTHAPFVKWFCTDCHAQHDVGTGKYEFVIDVDRLCTTCHFNRLDPSVYTYQHNPYQKGRCTDCHDPHASDYPNLLRMSPQELCVSCHKLDLVYPFPVKHKPYEINACADCHAPHASKYRGMTRLGGKQLCFSCHYDRQNELLMPVQHKPYQTGDCINCHGAHATPAKNLLLIPEPEFCLVCHVGLNEKLKTGYVHTPVKERCTKCHVPHASPKPALLPESRTDLCYLCHGKMRPQFELPSRHPVGNGLLHCDGCHDPHAGPGPNLVRKAGNQLCYICHKGLETTYEKLAHAKKAKRGEGTLGLCTNCHVPHGSQWKPLLADKQEPMCNNCHTKIAKARINHPYGEKYNDPWHGGIMHCTSCHGPHGTPYKKFTLLPDDGFCLKCHGEKRKDKAEFYSVHRLIPPQNEPKDKIKTEIPGYIREPVSETINKKVKTYTR